MSAAVFAVVLFAALLHAGWNAVVKLAPDKGLTATLVFVAGGLVSAPILPFLHQPAAAAWPFLAVSILLHFAYLGFVAGAYRAADMSEAYPLMRGTAPLIVALAGVTILGEHLSATAWGGVVLVSGGVIAMALMARKGNRRGVAIALANAVVIAGYTITDGSGARASGAPVAYTMWLIMLTAIPVAGWMLRRRRDFASYALAHAPVALAAGAGSVTAYALSLWAMTVAPVAVVAALRETSIVFAMGIAALALKEKIGSSRIVAAALIAAGAAALRLA